MTGAAAPIPAARTARDDLTARVFRALYADFDLHTVGGTYIAVPKNAPCFAGPSLGAIARQISDHERPDPAPPASHPEADTRPAS